MVGCDWCISILIVLLWSCFPRGLIWSCSLGSLLMYRSPVVFLDRWYPRFRNFNSVIPIDVIRVKSYVDSFLDPTGIPVWVSIKNFYLVPKRVVASLIAVLRNGGGLGKGKSHIPVMLFDPLLFRIHRESCRLHCLVITTSDMRPFLFKESSFSDSFRVRQSVGSLLRGWYGLVSINADILAW